MQAILLDTDSPFPAVNLALDDPNGLLAIGADLNPTRLISAYHHGIFPWFNEDQPVLWWSPDPRIGLNLSMHTINKSMRKFIRKTPLRVTINTSFEAVIRNCAALRANETWINPNMIEAYLKLHQLGHAHSVEVWHQQHLVGGLYGIAVGSMFCGESMFHLESNASKLAFHLFCYHFKYWGGSYIDGQVENSHLLSLGMQNLPRAQFITKLNLAKLDQISSQCWYPQELKQCNYP
ncbi:MULTISPECIES: leucyl/phenylalanyl-tRNA--protein transferase [unclassified Agarivorans]|uniref:leucyl/phenylalanyl-tRNA--protein transferase n=1 Tax=unclassified Agarivorans TaxID=2636026 RepID=UPI003D7EC850